MSDISLTKLAERYAEEPDFKRQVDEALGVRVIGHANLFGDDPSGGRPSYWLDVAAGALDFAVQCCGGSASVEIDAMERRCDELAAKLKEKGQ